MVFQRRGVKQGEAEAAVVIDKDMDALPDQGRAPLHVVLGDLEDHIEAAGFRAGLRFLGHLGGKGEFRRHNAAGAVVIEGIGHFYMIGGQFSRLSGFSGKDQEVFLGGSRHPLTARGCDRPVPRSSRRNSRHVGKEGQTGFRAGRQGKDVVFRCFVADKRDLPDVFHRNALAPKRPPVRLGLLILREAGDVPGHQLRPVAVPGGGTEPVGLISIGIAAGNHRAAGSHRQRVGIR